MLSNNNCIIYCINKNEVTKHEIIFFIFFIIIIIIINKKYSNSNSNNVFQKNEKMKKSELKFRFVIFLIM